MKAEATCKRPIMRYYGGKWRIAPSIIALMPDHEVYVEPFGGAASVLLQKPRAVAEVYNDLHGEVVNVFKQLRDAPEALLRGLYLTPYARDEYRAAYEPTMDAVEAARRFIFRSTAGIGSNSSVKHNGFRTSMNDNKHVTAVSWANLPEELSAVVERLRGVIIEHDCGLRIMEQRDFESTLHYVDPPYLAATRKDRTQGYKHEMSSVPQHEELLDLLVRLKGKVIVSGYADPQYDAALKGWTTKDFKARDQTSSQRVERVWMNFEPETLLL